LGRGGQGIVYNTRDADTVIKIAFNDNKPIKDRNAIEDFHKKVKRLIYKPIPLDINIAKPLSVLEDEAGYVMHLLSGMEPFSKLFPSELSKEEAEQMKIPEFLKDLYEKDKKTVEQQFYNHKYQLKYTCKLIENPLKKFVPQNKTRYFYRVQIPYTTTSENYNNTSWKDFKLGYIEAESQKEARKLLEDEFDCTLPSKVINNDLIGSKYQYILKIFPPDAYWDKYWSSTRFCAVCSNEFTVMDKINHFGTNGDNCCSPDCDTINNAKYSFLREEEYVQKLMKDEEGIHQPCIYLISNLKTGMVYVGQTTQYSTFRWYQHFKRPYSGSKFHNAILEHDLSDWTFQVIEIINDKTLEDKNIPYSKKALYINQREQYYINLYDSINNGYNTATANKELHELKKITENGLFTKEELFND
jgi:hypothetical protein